MLRTERKQRPRVASTQLPFLDQLLNLTRQAEHSQQVGDRRAILSNRFRDLLLSQLELIDQTPVAARLFDGVQVCALKILDERQNQHGLVVEVPHDGRNLRPAESRGGTKATFAGDELERISTTPHGYGLKEPARLERCLELSQLRGVELATRLERVCANARELNKERVTV